MDQARTRCGAVLPQSVTATGRIPHKRLQLFWRATTAITDTTALGKQLAAIGAKLQGDPAVKDPGRLMRLAGSIAWPCKDGRRLELTEFHVLPNVPPAYSPERMHGAFPPPPPTPRKALRPVDTAKLDRYASKAAVEELMVLEQTPEGSEQRNNTLFRVSLKLASLAKAGMLPEDWVRQQLTERARAIGLHVDKNCGERGIQSTISSAFKAARPREIQR